MAPVLPYVVYLIGLSTILMFFARQTAGSVIVATLFHGAVNTFGVRRASLIGLPPAMSAMVRRLCGGIR